MGSEDVGNLLGILSDAEANRTTALKAVCDLLPPDNSATALIPLCIETDRLYPKQFSDLLRNVGWSVERHRGDRNIAHRPFEIFWGNPYEPRHSKLLRFFLNPNPTDLDDIHPHGIDLLRMLFEVLGLQLTVDRSTTVECEVPTTSAEGPGFIDLLICRETAANRYAVIIENKVNGASDTSKQLQKYVNYFQFHRKFQPSQIHVFYVPRQQGTPCTDSMGDIVKKGVTLKSISFEKEMLAWLNRCLTELPALSTSMWDNLKHYRNLIHYLLRLQKGRQMNGNILEQLRRVDLDGKLPDLNSIKTLKEYVGQLEECHRLFTREKLLSSVQDHLRRINSNIPIRFYVCDVARDIDNAIESQPDFVNDIWLTVGIPVGNTLVIALTASVSDIEFGYRRAGLGKDPDFDNFVKNNYPKVFNDDEKWYYYCYPPQTKWETCLRDAPVLAAEMVEMYKRILPIWEKYCKGRPAAAK